LREALLRHMKLSIADIFNDRELLPNNEPSATLENSRRNCNRIVHSLFGPFDRSLYHSPQSRSEPTQIDEALGLKGTSTSQAPPRPRAIVFQQRNSGQ
jgi:hypothetical protein